MTGQGKSAIDTLLAESFKELAKKHPIEKLQLKRSLIWRVLSGRPFIIIFRISMNC